MQDRGVSPNQESLPERTPDRDLKESILEKEKKTTPDRRIAS